MSAVPIFRPQPEVRPKKDRPVRLHIRTQANLRVVTREQAKAKAQAKPKVKVGQRLAVFATIAGVAFMCSSLLGQVMVEQARREGIRAMERAREARKMEAVLRSRLDVLTNLTSVEEWAKSKGMLAPEQQAQPSSH